MRWLFSIVFISTLTVSAADLDADLKAGEALLERLPSFAEVKPKTTYWELSGQSASSKLEGYSVTTLCVTKAGDVLSLEYEVHSEFRLGQAQVTVDSKTLLDPRFHLKSATFHYTNRVNPAAVVEDADEEMTVEDGRVRARRGKNGEWKEFPVGQASFVWLVGELLQWVDLKEINTFAFRELNPVGKWVFPKQPATAEQPDRPPAPPKATEKTYATETWQYIVAKNTDGSTLVEGTTPGNSQFVRKLEYAADRRLTCCVLSILPPKDAHANAPLAWQELRVVSQERVEELKKFLQQPLPNTGRASSQLVPPPL